MVIFKHEMRQLRKSTIIWSIVLALAIFMMLPVYIEMVTSSDNVAFDSLSNNSFFDSIGTNIEILTTPLGMYSFLTFFIMFACAIHGMNQGLTLMTKEYRQNSADFLLTKPWSRTKAYMSKLLASLTGTFIIGLFYFLASIAGMMRGTDENFSMSSLVLISISIIFIRLFFIAFGMLIGVIVPKIRTTLSISTGIVFMTYVFGTFSRKVDVEFLGYFSPLHYFNGATVISTGGYEGKYMLLFICLFIIFIILGHQIFRKKDVMLVS